MKRAALPLLFLSSALCGCGGYYSVRVPYVLPELPRAAEARPALSGLYVKVVTAPPPETTPLGTLAGALAGRQGPDFRPSELARLAAAAVQGRAAGTCAWRVEKAAGEDPFLPRLSPSGVLQINVSVPAVSSRKEERSSVYYDRKKQRQTVKNKVWVYSASFTAGVKLYSWPALAELDSWGDTFSVSEDRFDGSRDTDDWYSDNEGKLFAALAARLGARYAGRPVERLRPVFALKKDAESEEALKLAERGSWDKAAAIWSRRAAAGGGWRDYLGLAVAAELGGNYAAADAAYRRAQAAAGSDKAARPVRWEEIYRDLGIFMSSAAPSGCGTGWFGLRTALLPFADETTSVDGPELVRGLLYERLKAAGYDMAPLGEVDEALRRRGFSEGGQLAAAKPEDVARWLGAGRLVYVNLTDFSEIMAGVYNRRMVKGTARVWDAASGKEQVFEESVVRVKTPKSFAAGLFGQLAKGLAERIRNKPLAYESGEFAARVGEDLPALVRPPKDPAAR